MSAGRSHLAIRLKLIVVLFSKERLKLNMVLFSKEHEVNLAIVALNRAGHNPGADPLPRVAEEQ